MVSTCTDHYESSPCPLACTEDIFTRAELMSTVSLFKFFFFSRGCVSTLDELAVWERLHASWWKTAQLCSSQTQSYTRWNLTRLQLMIQTQLLSYSCRGDSLEIENRFQTETFFTSPLIFIFLFFSAKKREISEAEEGGGGRERERDI